MASVLDEKSGLGAKGPGKVAAGALGKGGAAGTPAGGAAGPWMAAPAGAATTMSAAGAPGLLDVQEGSGNSDEPDDNNDDRNYVKNLALAESRILAQASADAAHAAAAATNGVIALAAFAAIGARTAPSRVCGCRPLQTRRSGQSPPASRVVAASLVVLASATAASSLATAPAYADSNPAGAAYRSDTGANELGSPKYREWDPVALTWSGEVELPSTGSNVRDVRLLINPQTLQRVVVSISSNGEMNLFRCDAGCTAAASWTRVGDSSFADAGSASSQYKYFDAAYEQASGQLLIVYDKSTEEAADIYYRTFDGAALSGESGFNYARGAATDEELVPYIRMASKGDADEITLVLQEKPSEQDDDDDGGDGGTGRNSWAMVWNGSSFGNVLQVTRSMSNTSFGAEAIGVDYEAASGASVVFSGEGKDTARYARWVPSSGWSAVGITDPDTSSNDNEVRFVSVKADPAPGSNRVMVCQVGDNRDLTCTQINAGALVSPWIEHDTAVDRANTRSFDFVWEPSGSLGLLVWGTSSGSVSRRTYSGSSNSWGATGTVQYAGTHPWIIGAANPAGSDTIRSLFISINSQQDFGSMKWDGSSLALIGIASLTHDSGSTNFEGGSIAFFKKKATGHSSRPVADSLAASDAVARAVTVSRSMQDSIRVVDTLSISDHVRVSDSISINISRRVLDSPGISDSISTVQHFARPAAESLALSDSVGTRVARSISDAVMVSDLVPDRTYAAARAFGDLVLIADATAKSVGKFAIDSLSASDTVATAASRMLSDRVAVADTAARMHAALRAAEDVVSIQDADPARTYMAALSMVDSLALTDSTAKALLAYRAVADELPLLDQRMAVTAARQIVDGVAAIDSIHTSVMRRLSDAITTADSAAALIAGNMRDSLAATDEITVTVGYRFSDSVAVEDAIAKSVRRGISESLFVLEAAGRSASHGVQMTEAVAVVDAQARKGVVVRLIDTVAAADTGAAPSTSLRISDSVSVVDAPARQSRFSREVADVVLVVSGTPAKEVASRLSDRLAATDATGAGSRFTRQMGDIASVADFITRTASVHRALIDTVMAADGTPSRVHRAARSVFDSVGAADDAARTFSRSQPLLDALAMADEAQRYYYAPRAAAESLAAAVQLARTYSGIRATAEALTVTDGIMVAVAGRLSDDLAATDGIRMLVSHRLVDAISIVDGASLPLASSRLAGAERVGMTDSISTGIARASAEMVELADSLALSTAKRMQDSLGAADAIAVAVSRGASDSVAITDVISKSVARSISEAIALTDVAAKSATLSASDSVSVADATTATTRADRGIGDSLSAADSLVAEFATARPDEDSVLVYDEISVAMRFARSAADSLAAQDAAGKTLAAARSMQDGATVADATTRSHLAERPVPDALGVQDGTVALLRFDRPAGDTLAIADGITRSVTRTAADSLAVIDSVHPAVAPGVFDSVSVSDSLGHARLAAVRAVADGIGVSDSTAAGTGARAGDAVRVSDSITISEPVGSRGASDLLSVTETVSIRLARPMSETLAVAESIKSARAVTMNDSVAVGVHVTDLSVHWNRVFDESFTLGDCTPFSCNQALHFNEGLGMQDAFLPPPAVGEVIAMEDSISRRVVLGKSLGEAISAAERTDFMIKPAPPEPQPGSPLPPASVLVVSNKTAAGLPSSVPVPGVYNWTGNTASLREVMKPTPHVINATVPRPDLPVLTMVLPTYHIPIMPSAELPGDDVLMTVMAAEVPAGTPVMVPINVAGTPEIAEHSTFAESMSIEFKPRVNTTNFSLVVTVVDAPPTIYSPPADDLKPLYIDVRWIGEFPGAEDPSVSSYYEEPPRFTFTVMEEWAMRENTVRDVRGVPMVKLSLLNESTGAWEEIPNITRPASAVDGIYTYVATLPHFSNYAVTADKVSAPPAPDPAPGASPGAPSSAPAVAIPPAGGLVVSLVESLALRVAQQGVPVEVVEEFGQKRLAVGLADAVAVLVKPVSYKSFTVGQVNVRMTVEDVRQESIAPPLAVATFIVEVENTGDDREEFVLNFWYYDDTGGRAYESSQAVVLGPMESGRLTVPVPFTSAGAFEVTAEARSVPAGDLLNTLQLTVTVPWLAVNLYLLVSIAIVILGSSVGTVALLLTRGAHGRLLPGRGGATAPRIRVVPAAAAVEKDGASAAGAGATGHDVLVRVSLRNDPSGGSTVASGPAIFELELENRDSRRRIEFALEYSAVDASSGTVLYRKAEKVRIDALSTEHRVAEVALPPGSYDFVVEAGQQGKKQGMQRGQGRFRVTVL